MPEAKEQLSRGAIEGDKNFYESKCATLDRQIDNLVYELYDLTPDEIAIVEGQKQMSLLYTQHARQRMAKRQSSLNGSNRRYYARGELSRMKMTRLWSIDCLLFRNFANRRVTGYSGLRMNPSASSAFMSTGR